MPRRRLQSLSGVLQFPQQQAGFSLIELILAMVLLGIIGTGVVLGLSTVVTGFMLSRESAATAAKGQLAFLRLSREFRVITSVSSATATSIQFTALHGSGVTQSYTVAKSGNTITLNDGTNNDVLVDQVNSLSLAYYDTFNGTAQTTWTATRKIIQISIVLNGPNNSTLSFSTRIAPRNI